MCYHATLYFTAQELASYVHDALSGAELEALLMSEAGISFPIGRVNGFALPQLPLVVGESAVTVAQWGLIPHWASHDGAMELQPKLLNARSETARSKPSFRDARPALLPVSGFVEWRHEGKKKIPYHVHSKESVMWLGCLWTEWTDKVTGEMRTTFTVLTTQANELMSYVHNTKQRMPVVVPRDEQRSWFEGAEFERLTTPLIEGVLDADVISE